MAARGWEGAEETEKSSVFWWDCLYPDFAGGGEGEGGDLNLCVAVPAAVHFKNHLIAKQTTSGSWMVCKLPRSVIRWAGKL